MQGWARDGLIDEQIANNMGIGYSTLQAWKNAHKDIQDALKKGKEVVDIQVENALLKRALGYSYDEVTQETMLDAKTGKYELKVSKIVAKQVAPDTTAQIFWLKNRKPQQWRDKQDVSTTIEVEDLSSLKDMLK